MVDLESTETIRSLWKIENQISEGTNVTESQLTVHSHRHSSLVLVFCCTFSARRPQNISNTGNNISLWRHWIERTDFSLNKKLQVLSIYIQYMWAGIAQSLQRLATGWKVWRSNPGRGEIFRTRSQWPSGP